MGHHSEAFIGIDTAKLRNAVAVAEGGRTGELRYLGEVDTSDAATRKLVAQLAAKYKKLAFCYEAGPTGYCQIEKLSNLEQLPPSGFQIICFPVKVKDGSAGWTRAVAIVTD